MLNEKVVVVTGAGGGIGRAIAVAAAEAGASVVINDIGVSLGGDGFSSEPAEETKRLIEAAGGSAVVNTDSVAEWDGAKRIMECALDTFGRIDGVVNNAGIIRDSIFHKMSPEEWQSVMQVNLNGCFYVSRAASEHFRGQQSGAYVHLVSTSGLIGNVGQANYSAAKLGVVALSKSIALDMRRFNVRSNCLAPFAWSRMTNSLPDQTPEEKARVERLKQMTPEKNAPLAVYLLSDDADKVSGQVFAVRRNELFLMGQSRPLRSVHNSDGWAPESIADHAMPALAGSFFDLDVSADVFSWDPI